MSKKFYPYKKRGMFTVDGHHEPESFLFGTLPSFIKSYFLQKKPQIKIEKWFISARPCERVDDLIIYWIGHASFLVQVGGKNILIDPIFGDASILFPRHMPPGISREYLPPIDMVLISHNHPDHLDMISLKQLKQTHSFKVLVPQGDGPLLKSNGFSVEECMWWDSLVLNPDFRFTFLPAAHWSRRGLFDTNTSLWGSWMIEYKNRRVYFGGDTAYSFHFKSIAHHFSSIDIALLPIAPAQPRGWMKRMHMNGEDAVKAHLDLQATHLVPMHWGTFGFGNDSFEHPVTLLEDAWKKNPIDKKQKLSVLKVGGNLCL